MIPRSGQKAEFWRYAIVVVFVHQHIGRTLRVQVAISENASKMKYPIGEQTLKTREAGPGALWALEETSGRQVGANTEEGA